VTFARVDGSSNKICQRFAESSQIFSRARFLELLSGIKK